MLPVSGLILNGIIPESNHSLISPSATKLDGTSSEIVGIPAAVLVTVEPETPTSLSFPEASTHTTP